LALRSAHLRARRDQLEARLLAGRPGSIVNGSAERISPTLNLSFPGLDRQRLLIALDLAGIYCSSGSACASGSSEPSHVLTAMGLSTERVESAIRLSVGVPTTAADVESSADRILKIINQL
jgi:cysteine desulfurase